MGKRIVEAEHAVSAHLVTDLPRVAPHATLWVQVLVPVTC
jgi:hypothetical protein